MIVRQNSGRAIAVNEFEIVEKIVMHPHPFIVSIFSVESFTITRAELFMLVMEYCPGGDLQEALDDGMDAAGFKYTPPEEALLWIGQVFLAVEHIHTKLGALVRDL